ncbi:hypothetical protein PC112_g8010 [Phytophthora cactorum]|nr:hypothetical protein PC112_g8010 [Phytophthora cactorum]KAG4048054.1 hypothetical protein PC123_g16616 [Phytophthora cactorum]
MSMRHCERSIHTCKCLADSRQQFTNTWVGYSLHLRSGRYLEDTKRVYVRNDLACALQSSSLYCVSVRPSSVSGLFKMYIMR